MTKVCNKCGNEEHCVCDEYDSVNFMENMDSFNYRTSQGMFNTPKFKDKDSISKAISKGLFDTPKCNNHTELKQENGECCQQKNKEQ